MFNWCKMSPRERDALVAEKVMEELIWDIWFDYDGTLKPEYNGCAYHCENRELAESCLKDFPIRAIVMEPDPKPYTTDISAAWEAVEKLSVEGFDFMFETHKGTKTIVATFRPRFASYYLKEGKGYCPTAPEAICLAALKAVGVDL